MRWKKKGVRLHKSENQGLISAARGIEPLIRLQYPVLYLSRLQRIYLRTFDTLIRCSCAADVPRRAALGLRKPSRPRERTARSILVRLKRSEAKGDRCFLARILT